MYSPIFRSNHFMPWYNDDAFLHAECWQIKLASECGQTQLILASVNLLKKGRMVNWSFTLYTWFLSMHYEQAIHRNLFSLIQLQVIFSTCYKTIFHFLETLNYYFSVPTWKWILQDWNVYKLLVQQTCVFAIGMSLVMVDVYWGNKKLIGRQILIFIAIIIVICCDIHS